MRKLFLSFLLMISVMGCAAQTDAPGDPEPAPGATDELGTSEDTSEVRGGGCIRTGCSGQICASQSVFTTCEWRPEYACYQSATCTRQADGNCGWTQTPELQSCLASGGGSSI